MRKVKVLGLLMRTVERLLWTSGCLMLSIFLGHLALAEYQRARSVAAFKTQMIASVAIPAVNIVAGEATEPAVINSGQELDDSLDLSTESPDQSLWSPGRIAAHAASLAEETSAVVGVFEIPRLGLEVPVYESVSDLHMDRGIARIDGTARPGQNGNIGIAGHRDGYFRVLQDIKFGDELVMTSAHGTHTYTVEQLMIVDPSTVEVLDPTPENAITLVTCYPFYFVGHAPERFIVRAVLQDAVSANM